MNKEVNKQSPARPGGGYDALKWLVAVALLLAVILGNHYYQSTEWAVRAVFAIVLFSASLAVLAQTHQGRVFWGFLLSAREELYRVTWPDYHETLRVAMVVVALVATVMVVLWAVDSVLMWAIGWITGQTT